MEVKRTVRMYEKVESREIIAPGSRAETGRDSGRGRWMAVRS